MRVVCTAMLLFERRLVETAPGRCRAGLAVSKEFPWSSRARKVPFWKTVKYCVRYPLPGRPLKVE
jgi:hypothetical protein